MESTNSNKFKVVVFLHMYYDDTSFSLYQNLKHLLKNNEYKFIININYLNPNYSRLCQIIEKRFPFVTIIKTSNVGKDIGAKLAMIQTYFTMNFESDYMLFLHDKKSPQLVHGDSWQSVLFKIITDKFIKKAFKLFESNEVGMIGGKENLYTTKNDTEQGIFAGNKEIVFEEAQKYNLRTDQFDFIGGTMFWVRSDIYESFFYENSPLKIRATFEKGNVMDDFGPTITHSWERLLGWIVTSKGYKIQTI